MLQAGAMTLFSALTSVAALLGLVAWRGWHLRWMAPHYRATAIVLCLAPAIDVAKWIAGHALTGPVPYRWPEVAAFHVHSALEVAWPLALLGAGLAAFALPSWPALAGWLASAAGLAMAYPELRQGPRYRAYAVVTWACCVALWAVAWRTYHRVDWLLHHVVLLILSIGTAVAAFAYLRPDPSAEWALARIPLGVAYLIVIWHQTAHIVRSWRQ